MSASERTNLQTRQRPSRTRAERATPQASLELRLERLEERFENWAMTLLQVIAAGLTRADVSEQQSVDAALDEARSIVRRRTRRRR